jgi:hypothetical protein
LGKGASGSVILARRLSDGKQFAIKQADLAENFLLENQKRSID